MSDSMRDQDPSNSYPKELQAELDQIFKDVEEIPPEINSAESFIFWLKSPQCLIT